MGKHKKQPVIIGVKAERLSAMVSAGTYYNLVNGKRGLSKYEYNVSAFFDNHTVCPYRTWDEVFTWIANTRGNT